MTGRGNGMKATRLLLAAVAVGLAACETPEPVRKLASRTAANVSQVSTHLETLKTASNSVATARVRNAAQLKSSVNDVRKRHTLDIALIKKAGDTKGLQLKKDIEEWMLEARAIARGMTLDEFKKAPDARRVDLVGAELERVTAELESFDTKKKALNDVAKTLAALSKKDDPKARIRFLIGYVKEVRDEVKEKQDEAKKAAESATKNAETAGSDARTDVKK